MDKRSFIKKSIVSVTGLTLLPVNLLSSDRNIKKSILSKPQLFVNPNLKESSPSGDRNLQINCEFPPAVWLQNGGTFYDITNPPAGYTAAVGDGIIDDTDAFKDAYDFLKEKFMTQADFRDAWWKTPYHVYVPNGTYRITDTLYYRGAREYIHNEMWDLSTIRIIGQSREQTILQLDDNCPGFQDKDQPKILLAYQHPGTDFNNGVASNELRNITIRTGNGNPGAVAMQFQGANRTQMFNVKLVSEDGNGRFGIWLNKHCIQGYYHDITVEGFDCGIYFPVPYNSQGYKTATVSHSSWEYVSLLNQNECGIKVESGGISVRKLHSKQSKNSVPSLILEDEGPYAAIIDSLLEAYEESHFAIKMTKSQKQCLFARNIDTSGYIGSISKAGETEIGSHSIQEYVSYPVKSLNENQVLSSLDLPIEDTPMIPWYNIENEWANVHDFGAVGDGIHDDTGAIQNALNSGKPVVYFPKKEYALNTVTIPASVKRIEGMNAYFSFCTFEIEESSSDPLLFVGMDGSQKTVLLKSQRDCIFSFTIHLKYKNIQDKPVKLFLDNANSARGNEASMDFFCTKNQKIWARSINTEDASLPNWVVNGGTMWVFGYKTEHKPIPGFHIKNNSVLEVLGGYTNEAMDLNNNASILVNEDSEISYTGYTNHKNAFLNYVIETRDSQTKASTKNDYPFRGGKWDNDRFIPLYVSYGPYTDVKKVNRVQNQIKVYSDESVVYFEFVIDEPVNDASLYIYNSTGQREKQFENVALTVGKNVLQWRKSGIEAYNYKIYELVIGEKKFTGKFFSK